MNRRRIPSFANPVAARFTALMFAIIMLALVTASPIALKSLAQLHGINWVNLSNVGQTYGAISALLSALALGGVVISILYQARDVRTAREQAVRSTHSQLLRMEMEDPFYMDITAIPWGRQVGLGDYDSLRRHHFIHMWVSFWEGQYTLGDMTEKRVRNDACVQLFLSIYGRRYWSMTREAKLANNTGRRLQFVKIVDEEYCKIAEESLPVQAMSEDGQNRKSEVTAKKLSSLDAGMLICIATAGSIVVKRLLDQKLKERRVSRLLSA